MGIGYNLSQRTAVTQCPVPTFQPQDANTCIALDIMPTGANPSMPFPDTLLGSTSVTPTF